MFGSLNREKLLVTIIQSLALVIYKRSLSLFGQESPTLLLKVCISRWFDLSYPSIYQRRNLLSPCPLHFVVLWQVVRVIKRSFKGCGISFSLCLLTSSVVYNLWDSCTNRWEHARFTDAIWVPCANSSLYFPSVGSPLCLRRFSPVIQFLSATFNLFCLI